MIASALARLGIKAKELDCAARRAIVERIRDRLGVDLATRWPWDRAGAPAGSYAPDGWARIADYVGGRACVMLPEDGETGWGFASGGELREVLAELPGFEFYVCDEEASYLLCHNHHDYLIGWGAALDRSELP